MNENNFPKPVSSLVLCRSIISDRRLLAKFGVAVIIVAALFYFRAVASSDQGMVVARYAGYWLSLVLVLLGGYYASQFGRLNGWWGLLGKVHRISLLVALLGALLWQIHEPHRFKVLYDEHAYIGISKTMHSTREAAYAVRSHHFDGKDYVLGYGVDKRSVLFPFLISVVHDLTGFRKENVFWVNGALGFVSLLLAYHMLLRVSSHRVALCGQLMWMGLPLLAQIATGGGYDLLNICLLQGWLLVGICFLDDRRGLVDLNLLVILAIALAQVRNESIIYMLGTALLIWMKWQKTGEARLSWFSVLSLGFLILPVAANVIFSRIDSMRETGAGQDFFSMEYMPDNLANAVAFMFNPDLDGMNSTLLAALGSFALVLFLVSYVRAGFGSTGDQSDVDRVLFVFVGMVTCVFIVYMGTFWGAWTDYLVSRFSLSIWLLLLVMVARVLWVMRDGRELPGLTPVIVGVLSLSMCLPASSNALPSNEIAPSREGVFLSQKLAEIEKGKILIVVQSSVMSIVEGHAACALSAVNAEPWKLQAAIELGVYKEIWVAEQYRYNYKTSVWVKQEKASLIEGFELSPVAEYIGPNGSMLRIERVVAWKDRDEAKKHIETAFTPKPQNKFDYFKAVIRLLP